MTCIYYFSLFLACKRKDDTIKQEVPGPKKPRLVFTDIQRRTLLAIFKETKRPSKEMQATIAEQLGLKVSTVANFFMNARRRSLDKYTDGAGGDHCQNNNDSLHENCELDSMHGSELGEVPMGAVVTAAGTLVPVLNSVVTDLDTQQIVAVTPASIATTIMDHHLQQHQQHLNPPATPLNNEN